MVSLASRGTVGSDLWCTADEFLSLLGAGDWEEHATLLANYLMWFDRRSGNDDWENYIVTGNGIPEGETVWVLRRQRAADNALLINASTVRVRGTARDPCARGNCRAKFLAAQCRGLCTMPLIRRARYGLSE